MRKRTRKASKPLMLSGAEWQARRKKQAAEEAAAIAKGSKRHKAKAVVALGSMQSREVELIERAWSKASPWKNLTSNTGGGINLEARLGIRYKKPTKTKSRSGKVLSANKPGKS